MSISLDVLVLPAFDDLAAAPVSGEADPWREAYDLDGTASVAGVPTPLRHDGNGLGVVPTGVGKVAAATTTTALCAGGDVDLEGALVLSVGIAGAPPDLPVGSVVLADSVVDWDDKCRFDPDDGSNPLALDPYTEGNEPFDVDPELLSDATELAADVDLAGTAGGPDPVVTVGTNVCADELWHGRTVAERVSWLVDAHDRGPYRATEMEDAGTAAALRRFGLESRYLSVRGISNHDRPEPGASARDSFFAAADESAFETGLENAVRVAKAVVDDRSG
jgi:purine nucleoside permease